MSRASAHWMVAAAATFGLLLGAGDAHAGTATIYQCTAPGGGSAGTDMLRLAPGEPTVQLAGACGNPAPGWDLRLGSSTAPGAMWVNGQQRELRLEAPADTVIVGGQIARQMVDLRDAQVQKGVNSWGLSYRLLNAGGESYERCGGENLPGSQTCRAGTDGRLVFPSSSITLPATSTAALRLVFGCVAAHADHCFHWTGSEGVGLGQFAVRISDPYAPTVQSVAGSLLSDQPVRGRAFAISAADRGLGLYRVRVLIDGQLVEQQAFDPSTTSCRDLGASTPEAPEFATARPCPTAATAGSFSFAHLPLDGEHAVRVVVEDAGGNQTVALDRTARFELPADELQCSRTGCVTARPLGGAAGAPNGHGASPQARLALAGRASVRARFGQRVMLRGRLRSASGAAIGDALVDVESRTARVGAVWRQLGQVRTDTTGAFRYRAARGPARVLRFAYRARVGDPKPAVVKQMRLQVAAGLALRLRPAIVNPGGAVGVTGRVLGSGIARGTFVELQALDGREWRTFKTLAVGRSGRFAYRYRFRHTSGSARFLWRVHVRAQAGLPYAAASSRPRWVLVR